MTNNEVNQNTNIDTRHATFGPGTTITGAINHIAAPAAPPSFKVDREDTRLLDTISRFLHKRWTDLKVKVASAILGALGIGGGVLWNRLAYSMWVFLASVLLLLLAVIGFAAVRHKHSRQCPSCKAHFALVEARGARAIDVDAADGTHRTTTRPYDCVNCGHRLERDSNEVLTEADED